MSEDYITIAPELEEKQKNQKDPLPIAVERTEQAHEAMDEFIQNLSHDIRTPLIGIIGLANLLEQEIQGVQEKEYAKMIYNSGEQLLTLLNNILDMVPAKRPQDATIETASFDLYALIKNICELELPTIKMKKLKLELVIEASVPQWIINDSVKLHRIILNLLGNAIKFTKQGTIKIHISIQPGVCQRQAELRIMISDSGVGIPAQEQTRIFDRFYQVNLPHQASYTGHGFGLHIVRKYVELLKGSIIFTSTEEEGSTFMLKIPVLLPQEQELDHRPGEPPLNYGSYTTELSDKEVFHPLTPDPVGEENWFDLDAYPLLDEVNGIAGLGDTDTLKELLRLLIHQTLPEDLKAMDQAYAHKNWAQAQHLAYKIKNDALYCGTVRLKQACLHIEKAHLAGYFHLLDALYQQFSKTVTQTILVVLDWLALHQ